MATTKTKSVTVPQLLETFRKLYPETADLQRMALLECVLFSILRENHSFDSALAALERLANRDNFIDWNDLRVSDLKEIRRYLPDYPDAEQRGTAIKRFLRELFRKNYKFEVEGLSRKTWKEAREELASYETLGNDFHISHVQVLTFGGHAFPVDSRIVLLLTRLGIAEAGNDAATVRGILEKNISKAQILQAIRLFEHFVDSICTVTDPKCKTCPLAASCNDYQLRLNPPKPAKLPEPKKNEPKPVASNEKKSAAAPAKPATSAKAEAGKSAPAPATKALADKPKPAEKAAAPVKPAEKATATTDKKTASPASVAKAPAAKPEAKSAKPAPAKANTANAAAKPPAKPVEKPKSQASAKAVPAKPAPAKPAPSKSQVKAKPQPPAKSASAKSAPAKNDKKPGKK